MPDDGKPCRISRLRNFYPSQQVYYWNYGIYAENDFVNEKLRDRLQKIDGIEARYDVKINKLSGQQVRELFDQAKADFENGLFKIIDKREDPSPYILAMGVIIVGRYGYDGSKDVRRAVDETAKPGTHETVNNRVPTREEAEQLIYRAGGRIERVERAHPLGKGHGFDHINYTTAEGQKATVQVESVGRQFYRDPARKNN